MKRVYLVAEGIVQGVCFRYYALRMAEKLNVTGWVRNLPDGRIEAVLEGDDSAVDSMADWFTHGPPGAFVNKLRSEDQSPGGEFDDFRVR